MQDSGVGRAEVGCPSRSHVTTRSPVDSIQRVSLRPPVKAHKGGEWPTSAQSVTPPPKAPSRQAILRGLPALAGCWHPNNAQPRNDTVPAVCEPSGSRGDSPLARKRLICRGPGPEPQRARKGPLGLPRESSPRLMGEPGRLPTNPTKEGTPLSPVRGNTDKNCVLLL